MLVVIGIAIGIVVGIGLAFLFLSLFTGSRLAAARRTRQLLLTEARREADALRREAQIKGYFHRHGFKILILGRFAVGFRTAAYLTAGILKLHGPYLIGGANSRPDNSGFVLKGPCAWSRARLVCRYPTGTLRIDRYRTRHGGGGIKLGLAVLISQFIFKS